MGIELRVKPAWMIEPNQLWKRANLGLGKRALLSPGIVKREAISDWQGDTVTGIMQKKKRVGGLFFFSIFFFSNGSPISWW